MRLLIDEWVQRTTSFFARLSAAVGIGAPRTHFADQVFVELTRELDAMELGPNPFEARTDGSPRKPVQSIVWALVRYQLEREAAAKLGEILIDSAPLMIDPETIQRVELARAGERVVIAESGGLLRAVTPATCLPRACVSRRRSTRASLVRRKASTTQRSTCASSGDPVPGLRFRSRSALPANIAEGPPSSRGPGVKTPLSSSRKISSTRCSICSGLGASRVARLDSPANGERTHIRTGPKYAGGDEREPRDLVSRGEDGAMTAPGEHPDPPAGEPLPPRFLKRMSHRGRMVRVFVALALTAFGLAVPAPYIGWGWGTVVFGPAAVLLAFAGLDREGRRGVLLCAVPTVIGLLLAIVSAVRYAVHIGVGPLLEFVLWTAGTTLLAALLGAPRSSPR